MYIITLTDATVCANHDFNDRTVFFYNDMDDGNDRRRCRFRVRTSCGEKLFQEIVGIGPVVEKVKKLCLESREHVSVSGSLRYIRVASPDGTTKRVYAIVLADIDVVKKAETKLETETKVEPSVETTNVNHRALIIIPQEEEPILLANAFHTVSKAYPGFLGYKSI